MEQPYSEINSIVIAVPYYEVMAMLILFCQM